MNKREMKKLIKREMISHFLGLVQDDPNYSLTGKPAKRERDDLLRTIEVFAMIQTPAQRKRLKEVAYEIHREVMGY